MSAVVQREGSMRLVMNSLLVLTSLLCLSSGKILFHEKFNDDDTLSRWIQSKHKDDLGEFKISAGKTVADPTEDKGLQTSQDAKFYGSSIKFDKFSNKGKTLVVQFTVKHEQGIDCGGGYIKLFGSDVEPEKFHGESPYAIMFGPDICGIGTKKVHVIFSHEGKNHLVKKDIRCKDDELTHMYRLVVKPSNEYEVFIDDESVEKGSLEDDFDILPPKMIDDDSIKKPEDWVEEEEIDDPEDKKPADWDKPSTIPDANAKKPEDWDDEMDGEWEAPQVDNPDYKGEWHPKRIPNPAYKGPWKQPQKPNPDFKENKELYVYDDISGVGFDLWQVKSGTIFDNLMLCDNLEECVAESKRVWEPRFKAEEKQREEVEKREREEAIKKEEEEKKRAEEEGAKEGAEEKEKEEDESKEAHDEL